MMLVNWDSYYLASPSSLIRAFKGFRQKFKANVEEWKNYYDNREPHKAPLPAPWNDKLTDVQKMIILRCLRPDKVCKIF